MAGDALSVPPQQRVGGDQPPGSARSWESGRNRPEQAPVGVGELGAVDLPTQHTDLVAQHDYLKFLRSARTHTEANQRNQQAVDDAVHEDPSSARIAPGQRPRPSFRHPHPKTLSEMPAYSGLSLPPDVEDRPLTKEETTEWHNERAKLRMRVNRGLAGGGVELECPQCAGSVITQLKTRNSKVKVAKSALHVTADVEHLGDIEYCCDGLLSVGVELLDRFQEIPHGTTAQQKRYDRRPQIENINGMVKDKGGFSDGWCRSFRDGARATSTIIAAFAHNLRLARPGTFHSTNGSSAAAKPQNEAPVTSSGESPGSATATRAPP